ncbi:uncharacterized protein LOC131665924 isoform X2 [Phymastichus coffea]|nr:uncharacterized protein LOC131665924 isoform X2 [Phymastichus coffea]XP_058794162.1 uncharacterized protein LOC131665924 isoform X2 [Phymastichus coffea]XP_058794163.1 uncharacterized protein LOC131665924 isoform X2 [Phymastichus coffea]XP_058794164.1 uncharacterized protein LOC131665924 isoform X2 [Phymastichus coffea]
MAGDDHPELGGFMDAKLASCRNMSQRMKKRTLAPWKVWRRHWCTVRKLGVGRGIEVLLDQGYGSNPNANDKDNIIKIPANAVICRTESRTKPYAFGIFPAKERKPLLYLAASSEIESQQWMAGIRQMLRPRRHRFMEGTYAVSMVDNAHSRSSGMTGLYGDLVVSRSGIFVKDVHSGEIVETIEWKETSDVHLATHGSTEDVKCICVIHTTKEFRGGVGELQIFCLHGPRLIRDIASQGRGPRQRHHHNQQHQRPLSLSEGDLRIAVQQEATCSRGKKLRHKITANLVDAGLGVLYNSRSGSEIKIFNEIIIGGPTALDGFSKITSSTHRRAIDNVYETEPASMNNVSASLEELEEVSLRRVSGISIASGIYEEILDDFVSTRTRKVPSNLYENPEELILNSSLKLQPPPLPPRQRYGSSSTQNGSVSDDGLDSEGGTRSTSPSTQEDATPTPEDKISGPNSIPVDLSEYVTMSPRLQYLALQELQRQAQEEHMYMVMR